MAISLPSGCRHEISGLTMPTPRLACDPITPVESNFESAEEHRGGTLAPGANPADDRVKVFLTQSPTVAVIAHRGFSRRFPENTIEAIRGAFELGADAVEVDVRMTEDGVPVLIHDPTVDRTTDGSGEVTFLSYSRIEELDACSWYGGAWSQCKVPSLEEALIVAREYDGILVLDLKPPISRSEVANILRIVECTGMLKRTMVMSWDGEIIWSVRRLAPSVPVGPVLLRRENPQVYSGYGYRFAAVPRTLIQAEPEYVSALAGRGMATMVWTINNESDVVSLSALGVRIFLSDVPLFIDDSRPNLK